MRCRHTGASPFALASRVRQVLELLHEERKRGAPHRVSHDHQRSSARRMFRGRAQDAEGGTQPEVAGDPDAEPKRQTTNHEWRGKVRRSHAIERDLHELEVIQQALGRMHALVSDLFTVSRLDRGVFSVSPECLNVSVLVRKTAALFISDEIEIHIQTSEHILVSADPQGLRQVLENLLANAVKHHQRAYRLWSRLPHRKSPANRA